MNTSFDFNFTTSYHKYHKLVRTISWFLITQMDFKWTIITLVSYNKKFWKTLVFPLKILKHQDSPLLNPSVDSLSYWTTAFDKNLTKSCAFIHRTTRGTLGLPCLWHYEHNVSFKFCGFSILTEIFQSRWILPDEYVKPCQSLVPKLYSSYKFYAVLHRFWNSMGTFGWVVRMPI